MIDFNDIFNVAPNCPEFSIRSPNVYFFKDDLQNAINYLPILNALDDELDPLQKLGLQVLVKLYNSNVGSVKEALKSD